MSNSSFANLDKLKDTVEQKDGILSLEMWKLRDAYGAERLGVNVRSNISKELMSRGLDHYPKPLPEYQEDSIRVFKQGTLVADLIKALEVPTLNGDKLLRKIADGGAQKTLDKISELLEA